MKKFWNRLLVILVGAFVVLGIIAAVAVHWHFIAAALMIALCTACAHSADSDTWILTGRFSRWCTSADAKSVRFMKSIVFFNCIPWVLLTDLIWGLFRRISINVMLFSLVRQCRNGDEEADEIDDSARPA